MILLITAVIGTALMFGISRLKKFTLFFQGQIFCIAMYIIEVLECIFTHTMRVFSSNAIVSIILMIVLPLVILFAYNLLHEFIGKKTENQSKETNEEEK